MCAHSLRENSVSVALGHGYTLNVKPLYQTLTHVLMYNAYGKTVLITHAICSIWHE